MIQSFFVDALHTFTTYQITEFFLYLILLTLGWFVLRQYRSPESDLRGQGATILTSMGISGTFLGILIGLQDFSLANASESITILLDGLKTAFLTSVTGLFSALSYQLVLAPWARSKGEAKSAKKSTDDLEPSDFYDLLKNSVEMQARSAEAIELVSKQLGGDGDSSLLTQARLSRQEFGEFRLELRKSLQEFAEMLSKSATEQIIEALRQVIKDFNERLTEQFGENFKRLNDAVFRLVEWQENYRVQLEQMNVRYQQSVDTLSTIAEGIADVSEKSKTIPDNMAQLKEIMDVIQEQIRQLDSHMSAFADLREKATESIPMVQRHVETVVEDITTAATAANDLAVSFTAETKQVVENLKLSNDEFIQDFTSVTKDSSEQFKSAATDGAEAIKSAMSDAAEVMSDSLNDASQTLVSTGESLSQNSKALVDNHRQALELFENEVAKHHGELQSLFANSEAEIRSKYEQLLANSENLATEFNNRIDRIHTELSSKILSSMDSTFTELDQRQRGYFGTLDEELAKAVSEHQTVLRTAMNDLSEVIKEQLQQVITEMGQGLTRVSGAMIEDISKIRVIAQELIEIKNRSKD